MCLYPLILGMETFVSRSCWINLSPILLPERQGFFLSQTRPEKKWSPCVSPSKRTKTGVPVEFLLFSTSHWDLPSALLLLLFSPPPPSPPSWVSPKCKSPNSITALPLHCCVFFGGDTSLTQACQNNTMTATYTHTASEVSDTVTHNVHVKWREGGGGGDLPRLKD